MNNKFHAMFRQGVTVIVVIILAIAAFWLVGRQAQPGSQPTAQDTDRPPPATPHPTHTPTAIPTATTPPKPTHTPFTPEISFGKGSLVTLPPPKSTPTPLGFDSDRTVQVISDAPLLSPEILSLMKVQENDTIWVEAWPSPDEIILRVGYLPHPTFWTVSREQFQAQQLTTFQSNPNVTAAVDELRQYNEYVDYVQVSPDGQWGAWGFEETLLVKPLGSSQPPMDLLGIKYENFATLAWSPQSDQIAYAVENGNRHRHELRLSDLAEQQTTIIPLRDTSPGHMAWSPDGQYVAFEILESPQSGINHLYLVKSDGSGLTRLTSHGQAEGPLHWSPTGQAIAYTYGFGDGSRPWLVTVARQ